MVRDFRNLESDYKSLRYYPAGLQIPQNEVNTAGRINPTNEIKTITRNQYTMKLSKFFYMAAAAAVALMFAACEQKGGDGGEPTPPVVTITALELNETAATLDVGESLQLSVTSFAPANADMSRVAWSVDNERVASIDATGKVTALAYGRTFAWAKVDGVEEYCMVTVNEPERNYKLVWEDNFDGTELNTAYWNYEEGGGRNQEKQCYLQQNVSVENGYLVITGKKEHWERPTATGHVNEYEYTSGRINTSGKAFIKYGKIEASISFPSGAGTWCAFWLMPNESVYGGWPRSGEVDIVEHVGSIPNRVSVAAHTNNRNGNVGSQGSAWNQTKTYDNVADHFHTYGIEWIDDYQNGNDLLLFTFDGEEVGRWSQTTWFNSTWQDWPFDQDFYVILNMAIGGQFGGAEPIDDSIFPVQMKVDWVRMYELE